MRVLAMHGVSDRAEFARVLRVVDRLWRIRRLSQTDGRYLTELTFDDGDESVVTHALPELLHRGMHATMFVCPGLVDEGGYFWWDLVRCAEIDELPRELRDLRVSGTDVVSFLKAQADEYRRGVLEVIRPHSLPGRRSVNRSQLQTWIDAGMSVGNHTWDHPCLDSCSPAEQRRQVEGADAWLRAAAVVPASFAYPNGDWTAGAEASLAELGYSAAFLFDHRLHRSAQHPLRRSRLRIDAAAPSFRAALISSGVHSSLMHLRDQVLSRRRGASS